MDANECGQLDANGVEKCLLSARHAGDHRSPWGSFPRDAIGEAEGAARGRPVDAHGFACAASVSVEYTTRDETAVRLRGLLTAAGYTPSGGGWWTRDGYRATATFHDGLCYATVFVYRDEAPVALAAGRGGYLHPGDRPDV